LDRTRFKDCWPPDLAAEGLAARVGRAFSCAAWYAEATPHPGWEKAMLSRKAIAAAVVLFCAVLNGEVRAQFQPGEFVTYSQGSWGGTPSPGNAAQLLADRFDIVYGFGAVEVGISGSAGFSLIFSWVGAVLNYLPSSGSPAPLNADLLDPTSTASGVFGGYVLALQLDVDFNDAGYLNGSSGIPFADLILVGTAYPLLNGLSVREYLAEANGFLGANPAPYTYDDIATLTEDVTRAFEGGTPTQFAQDHLRIPGLPGDFNHDDIVDAADYVVWRKGIAVGPTDDNYNLWRANFGQTAGSGATFHLAAGDSPGANHAVPEPASVVLAALAISMLIVARGRTFDERSSHVRLLPFASYRNRARGADDVDFRRRNKRPSVL
jgi:hypothetical protein